MQWMQVVSITSFMYVVIYVSETQISAGAPLYIPYSVLFVNMNSASV
jgi:hypothetical protein